MPLKWGWLIESNGYSASALLPHQRKGFVPFCLEPSPHSVMRLWRNKRPSCYRALAKEGTNCNISLKINVPQSSGRKPSLIAVVPSWHGHSNPREALESYQTWWGTTPIVPASEDSGANCKLKHHQRSVLIEGSLTNGHLQSRAGFHHWEKFPSF